MQPLAYQFEGFELLPSRRALRRHGKEVAVTPRAFDLLVALVERAGELVSKNELIDFVWPNVIVEENNLHAQISVLRKLLGPQAIATVPGRGYTFTLLRDAVQRRRAEPAGRDETSGAIAQGNLPAQLPPLYGRGGDIEALVRLLEQHRLVSVVGPAGIGKTRVAQAVAHALRGRYADGVWLVELAPLADPGLVVSTVARVLGCVVAKDDVALTSLVATLREQHLLLVLDNCEHLLPAVVDLATKVLGGAPQVRLLVTSQEPLHVAEECSDRLNALAVPGAADDAAAAMNYGAVELFTARAQAADPRFALRADNTAAVVDICRRLDGIPLAIELAAGRVPLLGVPGLRQRLDEQLRLLAGGARAALPRHQTLRAALEWSHALLSPQERTVFDRLGVFVGSFSMQAAQQLACDEAIDEWAVLDHLAALIDKSLVLVEEGDAPRYRLLESSRAFALERLADAGVLEALRRRHAQVMADTLTGVEPMEEPRARMRRLAPDLDNVRAAAIWACGSTGDRRIAIALAGATNMLWDAHACNDEGMRLFRAIAPWVDDTTSPRLAARYWFAVSDLRLFDELQYEAQAGLRAAELFRGIEDRFWLFRALLSAALKFSWLGDEPPARDALTEARSLLDPSWPQWCRAAIDYGLGCCEHHAARRPKAALAHFEAAVNLHRYGAGDGYFLQQSELLSIAVENTLGNFEAAAERARDLLGRSGAVFGARDRAFTLLFQGAALTSLGRLEEAEESLRAAVPQVRRAWNSAASALLYAAYLLARQQRTKDAARILGYIEGARTAVVLPSAHRLCDAANAVVAAALDGKELERLRAEGRQLTADDAIALAFPPRP
jgi:predicted ATPase/DNA-binding winged helix-turn-helix (wHTH) protein